ncbi:hypothetical protein EDD16DRAFT_1521024 [Pisolithus croceorrhizus]|nr:hypothetical protein EV401DRAFT_1892740 [Pisolithus croceorrhizus]KAI6114604.1 hypothetical protein EDD16DRAFT_1521024 [Pisolithus croceorrhizus]KAI6146619.1 hypothetical protein EDD17DRAFT_1514715 [Pisolithus thermaeus]
MYVQSWANLIWYLQGDNVDHPQQSASIKVVDGQTQPSTITGDDINQGEEPDCGHTVDFGNPNCRELQALFINAVAVLCVLQTFKLWHGSDFPPLDFPYNKHLNGHIVSWVQHVQAGQYTVDMIDLLEVLHHPHIGYSLQPYTRGPPYPSQQSVIEMAIVYLGYCIKCAVIHLLGVPQPSNWLTGWYANLCLDMKELEHLILVTILWESFSPILPACFHAYLRCREDQAQFQDEVQQILLGTFQMINQISLFILSWTPRSPNKYAGFVFPWWVDGSLQYTVDFE